MDRKRIVLALAAGVAIALFFYYDLGRFLSLAWFDSQREAIVSLYGRQPMMVAGSYFLVYVLVTALSLPGAAVMTLAGGAIFGLVTGVIIVSFASTIGATLAFLLSRTLFAEWVQNRFGRQLDAINRGVEKEGAYYLFTLRLVPLFPFFVINLVMGLTPIRTLTFFWVSQLGMLAGTIAYVNAGTQLAGVTSIQGILSPGLVASFAILGVFPLAARKLVDLVNARRVYQGFSRPDSFDNNLLVIGAGSGGLVASLIAATVKAKVTLVEKHRMGGDCLNTGCVPSKALIRSASMARYQRRSAEFGLGTVEPAPRFSEVMHRVRQTITAIEPHDSVERYTGLGVNCIEGEARLLSPWEVEVNGQRITSRNIVIATGARPAIPDIPGIEEVGYLTSDTIWSLGEKPAKLLVIGGGPIGCELAQAFNQLGSPVVQLVRGDRLLPREDPDVSRLIMESFSNEGIDARYQVNIERFEKTDDQKTVIFADGTTETFTHLLLATGRRPNVEGFGLEELGLELRSDSTLAVDRFLRTRYPNIFACGDVTGPFQFTHTASHQAWYATVNALFGGVKKFTVDYSVIPWCTFTYPEVARVGLSEEEARGQSVDFDVTRYGLDDLDRAIVDGEDQGFIKVLTVPGKDRILGVTIVGHHAGELIAEYVLAMKHGLGLNKVLGTIHIYPTLAESNRFVASEWKKERKPERLLAWVERFHNWQRK